MIQRSNFKGPNKLFGREEELHKLNAFWKDPRIRIVTIVAMGGAGKTALVDQWMMDHDVENAQEIDKVVKWSFFSKGSGVKPEVSIEPFITHALNELNDPEMANSSTAAREKVARLAQLMTQQRVLLVLDGMESLQHPPVNSSGGFIKDDALRELLEKLAQKNAGFCIITTRETVSDLISYQHAFAPEIKLSHLSEPSAIEMLKYFGLKGPAKEFSRLVKSVKGHALTLCIFGRYLMRVHNGDIRRRDRVKFIKADKNDHGGYAAKVVAAYEDWFTQDKEHGACYLALLKILGLFDRPVSIECLLEIISKKIDGLTNCFDRLCEDGLEIIISDLRECGLIYQVNSQYGYLQNANQLDVHHIIRSYFSNKLQSEAAIWRQSHCFISDYYQHLPKEYHPGTLIENEQLSRAVIHSCQAGEYEHALREIYWKRIVREEAAFNNRPYHERQQDTPQSMLTTLSGFFGDWDKPVCQLEEEDQALVLEETGNYLFVLGRLVEAKKLLSKAFGMRSTNLQHWDCAARDARLLREIHLLQGEIAEAENYAKLSISMADQSGDYILKMVNRAGLGQVLHYAGKWKQALEIFSESEALQRDQRSEQSLLFGVAGFWFCELLLDLCLLRYPLSSDFLVCPSERLQRIITETTPYLDKIIPEGYESVAKRANYLYESAKDNKWPMDTAHGHLILGRAKYLNNFSQNSDNFSEAFEHLNVAVELLRNTGQQHHLVRALIVRARIQGHLKKYQNARDDLNTAWEITDHAGMLRFQSDIYLNRFRIFHQFNPYPWDHPGKDLNAARDIIQNCGYLRREEELKSMLFVSHEQEGAQRI